MVAPKFGHVPVRDWRPPFGCFGAQWLQTEEVDK